jgi:hypothetical protein
MNDLFKCRCGSKKFFIIRGKFNRYVCFYCKEMYRFIDKGTIEVAHLIEMGVWSNWEEYDSLCIEGE